VQIVKYPKEKIILTDVDGCLVDWNTPFHTWMKENGHDRVLTNATSIEEQYSLPVLETRKLIKEFSNNDVISILQPLNDSKKYVNKLFNLGYRFISISSISLKDSVKNNRIKNLKTLFGNETFIDFVFLNTYESKNEILFQYKDVGKYWIEDNYKQYRAGLDVGLISFYLTETSRDENSLKSWSEIYSRILKNV